MGLGKGKGGCLQNLLDMVNKEKNIYLRTTQYPERLVTGIGDTKRISEGIGKR